jgi:exodeoxyribonuclease VII large subunit
LKQNFTVLLKEKHQKLSSYERMLQTLSPKSVLNRGFAIIRDNHNNLVKSSHNIGDGQEISIEFAQNDKLDAIAKKG